MIGKKAFQCMRNGKCPGRAGPDGCHVWWRYPVATGEIREGCALGQDVLFPLIVEAIHFASSAATSADKATNAACEASVASEESKRSAVASMALVLGVASGQIATAQPQLEQRKDDEEVPRLPRQVR